MESAWRNYYSWREFIVGDSRVKLAKFPWSQEYSRFPIAAPLVIALYRHKVERDLELLKQLMGLYFKEQPLSEAQIEELTSNSGWAFALFNRTKAKYRFTLVCTTT